jgi:RNA polymerase sigma-70 factor (ECF subfamily)
MHRIGSAPSGVEHRGTRVDRRAAFAELADHHLAAAYRLAGVILGDPVEAQDATHDAVVAAWRRYGSLRDPERFEAWFQRILVNVCRDRLRQRHRRPIVEIDLTQEFVASSDEIAGVDDRLALDRAFARLSPEQQIAVALRFYSDLTVDQIADRTRVPVGTVKSRLHAATRRLQAALGMDQERAP